METNDNLLKATKVKEEISSLVSNYEGFNRVAVVKNDLDSDKYIVLVLSSNNEIPDVPTERDGVKVEWTWNFEPLNWMKNKHG